MMDATRARRPLLRIFGKREIVISERPLLRVKLIRIKHQDFVGGRGGPESATLDEKISRSKKFDGQFRVAFLFRIHHLFQGQERPDK